MVLKRKTSPNPNLEIVLNYTVGETDILARVAGLQRAAMKAKLNATFAVSLPASANQGLPSNARILPWNSEHNQWASVLKAAPGSQAKHLLFWPATVPASSSILSALDDAAAEFDWVTAPRGQLNPLLSSALSLPYQDFGAPCVMQRNVIFRLEQFFGPGDPLLAPRMARAARTIGASLGQLPPLENIQLGVLDALGVNTSKWLHNSSLRLQGLVLSGALIAVSLAVPKPAVLALTLFGFGFLGLGYFFGKSE